MSDSEATVREPIVHASLVMQLGRRQVLLQPVLILLYVGTAALGMRYTSVYPVLSLVWLPAGIGIAAMLLFGIRVWPAIVLGSIITTTMHGGSELLAGVTATGSLLEALVGAFVLRNATRFQHDLGRVRDVLGFLVFGVAIAAMVGATVGTLALALDGIIPWAEAGRAWRLWWLGDAMGILTGCSLLLAWSARAEQPWTRERLAEAAALVLTLLPVLFLVYGGLLAPEYSHSLSFLSFPFVIWGALRFSQRGATTTVALTIAVAIRGALQGEGPFADQSLNVAMVFFYGYAAAVAVTGLLLGAATTERRRSAEELHRIGVDLEIRVNERTAALQEELTRRRRIQEDLQDAITSVKTLSGLLPICSSCKRIRDDHGYWTQVERYLTEHTQAQFSHGLCPECFKTLYPEYMEKNDGKTE